MTQSEKQGIDKLNELLHEMQDTVVEPRLLEDELKMASAIGKMQALSCIAINIMNIYILKEDK